MKYYEKIRESKWGDDLIMSPKTEIENLDFDFPTYTVMFPTNTKHTISTS